MVDIRKAEGIIGEVKNGSWREIIELQTNPDRDNYHAEILKYVLHILDKEKILSIEPKDTPVYLVILSRLFGDKRLNNGYYFKKKKDAKKFVEQYRKIIVSFPLEERELITEKNEKIKIIEINLLLEENVV